MPGVTVDAHVEQASPRILVIRLRRLGDVLRLTPLLRAIRNRHPDCQLDVAVGPTCETVLAHNPHIDQLIVVRPGLRAWLALAARWRRLRYDVVIDLQSSPRSAFLVLPSHAPLRVGWRKRWVRDQVYTHLVAGWDAPLYFPRKLLRAAAMIGIADDADVRLELPLSSTDRARAAALLEPAGLVSECSPIALSVVAQDRGRQWPAERFAALADRMQACGARLVLTHGDCEFDQVRAVVQQMRREPALWNYGATTLGELAAIYSRCALWIGNDGGPKHVATAVGCPTVTIVRRSDAPVVCDATDAHQVAVSPEAGTNAPDSVAAVNVERVYTAARGLLEHLPGPAAER
jgi:lipopolysaccharide heptosyltransferase III